MNKSKMAKEIVKDIYTFNTKYEKAKSKFTNGKLSETQYANSLYVLLSEVTYLQKVINKLQEMGYKFAKHEKEICVLEDISEQIANSIDNSKLNELSVYESFSLVTYLTKYEQVLQVIEYEELKDKVEHV